jgi:hypothetical protein
MPKLKKLEIGFNRGIITMESRLPPLFLLRFGSDISIIDYGQHLPSLESLTLWTNRYTKYSHDEEKNDLVAGLMDAIEVSSYNNDACACGRCGDSYPNWHPKESDLESTSSSSESESHDGNVLENNISLQNEEIDDGNGDDDDEHISTSSSSSSSPNSDEDVQEVKIDSIEKYWEIYAAFFEQLMPSSDEGEQNQHQTKICTTLKYLDIPYQLKTKDKDHAINNQMPAPILSKLVKLFPNVCNLWLNGSRKNNTCDSE